MKSSLLNPADIIYLNDGDLVSLGGRIYFVNAELQPDLVADSAPSAPRAKKTTRVKKTKTKKSAKTAASLFPAPATSVTCTKRVLNHLQSNPGKHLTAREISIGADVQLNSVYGLLATAVKAGTVAKSPRLTNVSANIPTVTYRYVG